ncbi:MAG: lysophospholipid acyltransferase family protein [Kiritimatiellia bacterium]
MTFLLHSLSWIFGHVPLRFAQGMGAAIGMSVWLFSFRKKEVTQRIVDCLGIDRQAAKRIQRRMYRNLGCTVGEFLRMPYMSEEEADRMIEFRNTENIPEDRRYIAVVAHTGNWELLAAATPLKGFGNLNIVVKELKPQKLNRWICRVRSRWGTRVHDRRGSSRELIRVLKSGEPLGFILDQNTKKNWGVFVDFFGRPACTTDGLAQLAAISGYEIHPVFCYREPTSRKLIVEVGDRIQGPTDRSEAEITKVTAACTAEIETFIRKHPDQWIWMHRRWRTRPPDEIRL